jgi:hypothetical protein
LKRGCAIISGFSSDSGLLVKLQVINGTNWLNLGGDVHSFKLVLGRPPSTSSDVTLQAALARLNEVTRFHSLGLNILQTILFPNVLLFNTK